MFVKFKMDKKSIIFDHDETLANNNFKSNGDGFVWAIQDVQPDLISACYDFMDNNPDWRSWNRYEFFRRLLIFAGVRTVSSFNNVKLKNDRDIVRFTTSFSKIVVKKTIENGLYDGVLDTLRLLNDKGIYMYVVSGTSHNDILQITEKNGVAEYMSGVYGFGWSKNSKGDGLGKEDAYEDILLNDDISPEQRMVVGDGYSDQKLAAYIGCDFVGIPREHTNNWGPISSVNGIQANDDMVLVDSVTRLPKLLF